MQLNSIFFPAPKTTQSIDEFKDHVIWIPRRKFYNYSSESPKIVLNGQQFTKKFGNQVKSTFQIQQPLQQEEDDYNPYATLTTQEEDDLIQMDETVPTSSLERKSLPSDINNYITKNFLDVNSFQTKTPSVSNYSSRQSSPRLNEYSYVKAKGAYFKQSPHLMTTFRSLNEEFQRYPLYDYEIQSELCYKNKTYNEYPVDESEFFSQPNSGFAKALQKHSKLQHIHKMHNKCQSADNSPFKQGEVVKSNHIVASLLKSTLEGSQYLMIYFHSNGEDIVTCYELVNHFRKCLNVHVVTVEYPGYTYYPGSPSAEQIEQDSLDVYYYFNTVLKIPSDKIIIIGRSIGTGPATYLASQCKLAALALISPFTSLRDLVKDKVGSIMQYLIQQRFNNLENIKKVACPTFICHGQKDSLIQISHSQTLHNNCSAACELILPKDMQHNQLDYFRDLTVPLANFLSKNKIKLYITDTQNPVDFPDYLFENPYNQEFNKNQQ